MERRRLGRTDSDVSALCLGTMMYGDQIGQEEAWRQMDVCLNHGIDFFDTAELYTVPPKPETQGESERIIGRWMAESKNRDKVFLASKVAGRSNFEYLRDGRETRLSRADIIAAVDRSLQNLQTDYLDLYQTHWPDRRVQLFGASLRGYRHYNDDYISIAETLDALGDLVKAGKIRHIGVSNETSYGVMQHVIESDRRSLPRIVSIQNAYSLLNRTFENGLAEIAMEEQVGLLAYSPIAQGILTGKYLEGANPPGSRGALFKRLDRYLGPGVDAAVRKYCQLADDFNVHPAALALQFVTTRPFVTSNIFGASNKEQLDIALASASIEWTDEMENAVNEAFAIHQNPSP